jgi:hypothetical protein
MHFNNPAQIALWELPFIWPTKPTVPDYILSIGTGTSTEYTDWGFFSKFINPVERHLDGERAWSNLINSTPENLRPYYHRINLLLDTAEPDIDDVSAISDLRLQTESMLSMSAVLSSFQENLIASLFYFELQDVKTLTNHYECTGQIICRLDLPKYGRQALYQKMKFTNAYFLVNGTPLSCVKDSQSEAPHFKYKTKFTVDHLDCILGISLNRLPSGSWKISGLPRTVREIIKSQPFDAPFGTADHQVTLIS